MHPPWVETQRAELRTSMLAVHGDKMLFKQKNYRSKFCVVKLNTFEKEEISRLITENGGEICDSREPPVITLGTNESICEAGKPAFHINFIRECIRRQKVLPILEFIIGSPGFYGCLQSILVYGQNSCQSHLSTTPDLRPSLPSSEIVNRLQRTHIDGHGDSLTSQKEEKPSFNAGVLLSESSHSPAQEMKEDPEAARFVKVASPITEISPKPGTSQIKTEQILENKSDMWNFIDLSDIDDMDFEPCPTPKEESSVFSNKKTGKIDHTQMPGTSKIIEPIGDDTEVVEASREDKKAVRGMASSSIGFHRTNKNKAKSGLKTVVEKSGRHRSSSRIEPWEQRIMINYLIDNNRISEGKGLSVWKQLIADGKLTWRTPQSLNNHFRKYINVSSYKFPAGMHKHYLKQFKKLLITI